MSSLLLIGHIARLSGSVNKNRAHVFASSVKELHIPSIQTLRLCKHNMASPTNYSLIGMLFWLYFMQGLPYGLQVYYIPLVLRQKQVTLTKIALLRLTTIPWVMKFLWAPVFDYWNKPTNGWITTCFAASSGIFFVLSFSAPNSGVILAFGLTLLNLSASVMDIAVDSFAVQSLGPQDLGLGNVAQAVGYKAGILITGGILLYSYHFLHWMHIFLLLGTFYFIMIGTFWIFFIPKNKKINKPTSETMRDIKYKDFTFIVKNLASCSFKDPVLLLLLLTYKLGEHGFLSMLPLYFTDQGLTIEKIRSMTGVNSILFSIVGSTLSGVLISKLGFNALAMLKSLFITRTIVMAGCLLLIYSNMTDSVIFLGTLIVLYGISGTITTALFTYMMQYCQTVEHTVQASFYTFLATLEVLGKLSIASSAGAIIQTIGYWSFFIFCLSCNIIPLSLSWLTKDVQVRDNLFNKKDE